MDNLGSSANFDALKEPRGFVRVLQLLFAIFAFSTTAGFNLQIAISPGNCTENSSITVGYPFNLQNLGNHKPVCNPKEPLYGDFSSGAQFFVFVGVLTFLYCIGILILYLICSNRYRTNEKIRNSDFIISICIVILWFLASAIWAGGTDQLKRYTDPSVLITEICNDAKCDIELLSTFAGLNISLVFGFANVALWAASLWFLWKETSWFSGGDELLQDSTLPPVDGGPL